MKLKFKWLNVLGRLQLTCLLLFVAYTNSNENMTPNSKTVNHTYVATATDLPYHVLVVYENLYCSGTLLSNKIVLTTAFCLTRKLNGTTQKTYVKAGGNSITGTGQVIPVVDIKIHEYFRYYSGMDNDIAMLVLKEDVQFNDNVKKVVLGNPDVELGVDYIIEVSGWGKQSLPQMYASMLLKMNIVVAERHHCSNIYGKLMTASNFCAQFQSDLRLTDVGGPATYKQQLFGILSFNVPSQNMHQLAVFTNVTYFRKWIQLNTKRFMEKYCKEEIYKRYDAQLSDQEI